MLCRSCKLMSQFLDVDYKWQMITGAGNNAEILIKSKYILLEVGVLVVWVDSVREFMDKRRWIVESLLASIGRSRHGIDHCDVVRRGTGGVGAVCSEHIIDRA